MGETIEQLRERYLRMDAEYRAMGERIRKLTGTPGPDRAAGIRALAALVPPDVLRTSAGEVSDPGLAALLRAAADGQ